MAPLFSIATPTWNALAKLRRCVGSVRGQRGVTLEHLVQDACSKDGTPEWMAGQTGTEQARFAGLSEPDQGMYDAINRAWSRAGGRYLSWLNADEQLLPGALARVAAYFDAHPEVDAVFSDYLVVDDAGRAVALRREIPLRRFYVVNTFLYAQSCTLFFRRTLWDRGLLRLDDAFRYAADKDLVLRLMDAGVRFAHLPEVLAMFGVDGNNLSSHDGMKREAEAVRLAHGALRWQPLRSVAFAARRIERLLRGAYQAQQLDYDFAVDETPSFVRYRATGLGGRYSLSDVTGSAHILSAAAPAPVEKDR